MGMARNTLVNDDVEKKKGGKKGAKGVKDVEIDFTSMDHPYVVALNKKLRALRKKQEKIKSLEDSLYGQNKKLNEQQLEVLSNKAFVDKMIIEIEGLRQLYVETLTATPTAQDLKDDFAPVSEEGDVSSLSHLNEEKSDIKDVEELVNDIETERKGTTYLPVTTEDEKFEYVHSVLKLLHAVSLHQALGHDVPIALDYFVKVIMGGTRPPAEVSFPENLAESMEEVKKYVQKSEKIVAMDMSYHDLSESVDRLVAPKSVPVVLETQINFFTESELDKETKEEVVVHVEEIIENEYIVVDEETNPLKPQSKRPNSGNRRYKTTSPRDGSNTKEEGNHEKTNKPRKMYQPRSKPQGNESMNESGRAAPRTYVPKSNNSTSPTGNGEKRASNRRPNPKNTNGERQAPRPKKVDNEVTP